MKFEELYTLRLCKPEEAEQDAPIIAPLIQEMCNEAKIETLPETTPLVDIIYSLVSTGFSEFVIAEVEEKPVGCLQINYRLSTWQTVPYGAIEDFYVRADVRKLGIERNMLDYACHRAEARGCAFITIEHVQQDNTRAIRSYEQMGFEQITCTQMKTALPRTGNCAGHSHAHAHTHTETEAEVEA